MRCAIESWSHLKRLEIREDPKGTKDPFWVSLALEDVLATLTSLEELSFTARPTLKTEEEPFPGFLRFVKEKAKQYPSLTALRNCFFATDKALEVLGKAFPKLTSLELINPSLAVNNLGNSEKLTNQGIVHLDSDYPFLKELKISGSVSPVLAATSLQSNWLSLGGQWSFYSICSRLSSLSLEGLVCWQLGLDSNETMGAGLTRLNLEWPMWGGPLESVNLANLANLTSLTDVSLANFSISEVEKELRRMCSLNENLRQLQLTGYYCVNLECLGVLAAEAKSLTSLTLHSNDQTLAFTNVIYALSPARARLQLLKLRLWCIGQALPIQEMWPILKELSLEFHHSQGQEQELNALLQVCTNLERLKLQRLEQNYCMYAFLSGLERLTSLRHLEVGPSVSNSCVKRILALTQLRSLVLRDSFKLLPSYLCKRSEHPNLQSLALLHLVLCGVRRLCG